MKIRSPFTVPEGKPITEAIFIRVMLASVCSILLCMTCLAGATWAWFVVGLENTGNVIEIATVTAEVEILENGDSVAVSDDGCYHLDPGEYTVTVSLNSNSEEPTYMSVPQNTVYVIISVRNGDNYQYFYESFENREDVKAGVVSVSEDSAAVSFEVSWVQPIGAEPFSGGTGSTEETPEALPEDPSESKQEEPQEMEGEEPEAPTEMLTELPQETVTDIPQETMETEASEATEPPAE